MNCEFNRCPGLARVSGAPDILTYNQSNDGRMLSCWHNAMSLFLFIIVKLKLCLVDAAIYFYLLGDEPLNACFNAAVRIGPDVKSCIIVGAESYLASSTASVILDSRS